MPTAITLAAVDPTDTAEDVVADAILGGVLEVYPQDADPVWVNPTAAVVVDPRVVGLILNAAVVGLEGSDDPLADAALYAVTTLLANHVEEAQAEPDLGEPSCRACQIGGRACHNHRREES